MSPIETEWYQLKIYELRGQMLEHEIDLVYAVIDGVESKAKADEYSAERYKFPSKSKTS